MNDVNKEIGARIRELRELSDITTEEIANELDVDEETRMNYFDVTRNGKGFVVDRKKEYRYENLCKHFVHKKAEMFIVTVDPKEDAIPSLNSHAGQEFNYVLQGSLKIFIKDNEIILNEGDSIFFDATCKHAMVALNDETAKFLAVIM